MGFDIGVNIRKISLYNDCKVIISNYKEINFVSEEKILRQCYSNFKNHLESMLCHRRICISVKLPDDTGAACPRSTLGDVVEA